MNKSDCCVKACISIVRLSQSVNYSMCNSPARLFHCAKLCSCSCVCACCKCMLCSLWPLMGHVCVIPHAKSRSCLHVCAFGPPRWCQGSMAWCRLYKPAPCSRETHPSTSSSLEECGTMYALSTFSSERERGAVKGGLMSLCQCLCSNGSC